MDLLFSKALRVSGKRYRPSSLKVQLSRWKALCIASGPFRTSSGMLDEQGLRQTLATFESATTQKRMFLLYRWVVLTLIARGEQLTPPSPAIEREYVGDSRTVHTVVDSEEHFAKMAACALESVRGWKGLRLAALVAVLGDTGLRTEEVRLLPLNAFHFSDSGPLLTLPEKRGTPARELKLSTTTVGHLRAWLAARPAVPTALMFPADLSGVALDPATIWRQLKRLEAHAGPSVAPMSGATALRAAFAGRLKQSGAPVAEIQQALGHRHSASTSELLERVLVLKKPVG